MSDTRWGNLEDAARDAYTAFCDSFEKKPDWAALPHPTKVAWGAAVQRTLAKAYRIIANDLIEGIRDEVSRQAKLMDSEGN